MPAPDYSVDELAIILARNDDDLTTQAYDELSRTIGPTIADSRFRTASQIVDRNTLEHQQRVALDISLELAMVHVGEALAAIRALTDEDGEAFAVAYAEEERGTDITDFLNTARRSLNAAHAINRT